MIIEIGNITKEIESNTCLNDESFSEEVYFICKDIIKENNLNKGEDLIFKVIDNNKEGSIHTIHKSIVNLIENGK